MESMKPGASQSQSIDSANPIAIQGLRFSQLSVSRQTLVRLCQSINYGSIQALSVKDGEPAFSPPPLVLIDVKLDADEGPRPELDLSDFELCDEVRRLIDQLRELTTGIIEHIEVRGGVPRRIVFRGSLTRIRCPLAQRVLPVEPASESPRTQISRESGYER